MVYQTIWSKGKCPVSFFLLNNNKDENENQETYMSYSFIDIVPLCCSGEPFY